MISPAMLQMVLSANQGSPFGKIPEMIMNDGPRVARTDMPGLEQAASAIGRIKPGGGGGGGQDWLNKAQNTPLSGGEELMFQSWIRNTPWFQEQMAKGGQEPDLDNASYDFRGAWKAGVEPKKTAAGQWDWAAANPRTGDPLKHTTDPTYSTTFSPQDINPASPSYRGPAPSAGGAGGVDAIADDVMKMFGQPPAPPGVDQGAHTQLQAALGREASAPPPFVSRVSGGGGMAPPPPAIDVPFAPGNGPGGVPPQFAQNLPPSRVPPGATQQPNMMGVGPGSQPPPWMTPPINPNGQAPGGPPPGPPPGANMAQDRSRMLRDFGLAMMANSGIKPFGQDNSLFGNIGRSGQQTMSQADAREKEGYTRQAGSEAARMKDRHHKDEIAVKREGNQATNELRKVTIQATAEARKTQNEIRMLQVQLQRQGNQLKEGDLRVKIEDGRRRALETINKDPMLMADPKSKQKAVDEVNRTFDAMGSQYGVPQQGGNTSAAPAAGAAKNGGATPTPAAGKRITKDGKTYEHDGRGWKLVQ